MGFEVIVAMVFYGAVLMDLDEMVVVLEFAQAMSMAEMTMVSNFEMAVLDFAMVFLLVEPGMVLLD